MISIGTLWIPILVSALIVWVASAIVWMALPHHKSDYKALPNEDAAIDVLRAQNLTPGLYNIPNCKSWDDLKKPEVLEKFIKGPIGFLTILPNGVPNMTKSLILSFIYYLIVGIVVAYLAGRTLLPGTEYLTVFQLTGTVAWAAYGMSAIQDAVWFGRPWSMIIKMQFDALLYGMLTGGVFGWLWPKPITTELIEKIEEAIKSF